jgi:hypothetical protein
MSRWIRALVGGSESTRPLGRILEMTTPNTFLGAVPLGVFKETALLDSETGEAEFLHGGKGHPSRTINQ